MRTLIRAMWVILLIGATPASMSFVFGKHPSFEQGVISLLYGLIVCLGIIGLQIHEATER